MGIWWSHLNTARQDGAGFGTQTSACCLVEKHLQLQIILNNMMEVVLVEQEEIILNRIQQSELLELKQQL